MHTSQGFFVNTKATQTKISVMEFTILDVFFNLEGFEELIDPISNNCVRIASSLTIELIEILFVL